MHKGLLTLWPATLDEYRNVAYSIIKLVHFPLSCGQHSPIMDALMIYTYIAAGCAAMLLLQGYMARCFSFLFNPQLIFLLHRSLTLPYLFRRRRFWGPVTRLQAILHLLYFGGTLVFNILGVSGLAAASSRAALLAVLHLIPTLCVPQFSLAAELCGISLSTYSRIHRTFGIMATLQTILHVALALREVAFSLADRIQRYGFMVEYNP